MIVVRNKTNTILYHLKEMRKANLLHCDVGFNQIGNFW